MPKLFIDVFNNDKNVYGVVRKDIEIAGKFLEKRAKHLLITNKERKSAPALANW